MKGISSAERDNMCEGPRGRGPFFLSHSKNRSVVHIGPNPPAQLTHSIVSQQTGHRIGIKHSSESQSKTIDPDEEFEFGLNVFLAGLERRLSGPKPD